MRFNHIIGSCLVAIAILLAVATLRPMFSPDSVRAQRHYEYQLVEVEHGTEAPATFSKLTKEGWEPLGLSFVSEGGGQSKGYLLFRR